MKPLRTDIRGRGIWEGDMVVFHASRDGPYRVVSLPEHPRSIEGHPQGTLHLEGLRPLLEVRDALELFNR